MINNNSKIMRKGREVRKVIRDLNRIIDSFPDELYEYEMSKVDEDTNGISTSQSLRKQSTLAHRKVLCDLAIFKLSPFNDRVLSLQDYIIDAREAYKEYRDAVNKGVLRNLPEVVFKTFNFWNDYTFLLNLNLGSEMRFIEKFYEHYPEVK